MIPTGTIGSGVNTRTSTQLPRAPSSGNLDSPTATSASLKGKLQTLEEIIRLIRDEETAVTRDVQKLRADKDVLENDLTHKSADCREMLLSEISGSEDEMQRHISSQKAENSRLQIQITQLKADKSWLQEQIMTLTQRIQDIENSLGGEEHPL